MLFALFVFSLPVLVSAGAANSGVSAKDPEFDTPKVSDLNLPDNFLWISRLLVDTNNSTADNLSTGVTPIYQPVWSESVNPNTSKSIHANAQSLVTV